MLGYIPHNQNKTIGQPTPLGHDIFEAIINRATPDKHPENQIGITVKVKKAPDVKQ